MAKNGAVEGAAAHAAEGAALRDAGDAGGLRHQRRRSACSSTGRPPTCGHGVSSALVINRRWPTSTPPRPTASRSAPAEDGASSRRRTGPVKGPGARGHTRRPEARPAASRRSNRGNRFQRNRKGKGSDVVDGADGRRDRAAGTDETAPSGRRRLGAAGWPSWSTRARSRPTTSRRLLDILDLDGDLDLDVEGDRATVEPSSGGARAPGRDRMARRSRRSRSWRRLAVLASRPASAAGSCSTSAASARARRAELAELGETVAKRVASRPASASSSRR